MFSLSSANLSLHHKIKNHDVPEVIAQLKTSEVPLNRLDENKMTLLQLAVTENMEEVVLRLLNLGADINRAQSVPSGRDEKTVSLQLTPAQKPPLLIALENGYSALVQILLFCGADVSETRNLLKNACEENHDTDNTTNEISEQTPGQLYQRKKSLKALASLSTFTVNINQLIGTMYWLIKNYNSNTATLFQTIVQKIKPDVTVQSDAASKTNPSDEKNEVRIEIHEPLLNSSRQHLINGNEIAESIYGLMEFAAQQDQLDILDMLREVTHQKIRSNYDILGCGLWTFVQEESLDRFVSDKTHMLLTIQQCQRCLPINVFQILKTKYSQLFEEFRKSKISSDQNNLLTEGPRFIYDLANRGSVSELQTCIEGIYPEKDFIAALDYALNINNFVAICSILNVMNKSVLYNYVLEDNKSAADHKESSLDKKESIPKNKKLSSENKQRLLFLLMFHHDQYPYDLILEFKDHLYKFIEFINQTSRASLHQETNVTPDQKQLTLSENDTYRGVLTRMIRQSIVGIKDSRSPAEKETQTQLFKKTRVTPELFTELYCMSVLNISSQNIPGHLMPNISKAGVRCGLSINHSNQPPVTTSDKFSNIFCNAQGIAELLNQCLSEKEQARLRVTSRSNNRVFLQELVYRELLNCRETLIQELSQLPWHSYRFHNVPWSTLAKVGVFSVVLGGTIYSGYTVYGICVIQDGIRQKLAQTYDWRGSCTRFIDDTKTFCAEYSGKIPDECAPGCHELESYNLGLGLSSGAFGLGSLYILTSAIGTIVGRCRAGIVQNFRQVYHALTAGVERFENKPLNTLSPTFHARLAALKKELSDEKDLPENTTCHELLQFIDLQLRFYHTNYTFFATSKAAKKSSRYENNADDDLTNQQGDAKGDDLDLESQRDDHKHGYVQLQSING